MRAGYIQFSPDFGDVEENIQTISRLVESVDAELIILPELCNTGYLFTSCREVETLSEEIPAGRTTQALCSMANHKHAYLV